MLTVIAAISAFAATNVDDAFTLMLFLSRVGENLRRSDVYAGQCLGFAAIVAVSLSGFLAGFLLPRPWIGLLGFVPIMIGISRLDPDEREHEIATLGDVSSAAGVARVGRMFRPQMLNVAAVTFANSSDKLGIYIPFFAAMRPTTVGIAVAVFFALVPIWWWLASTLAQRPAGVGVLCHYSRMIVPFVLIGVGLYILAENESFRLLGFIDAKVDELVGPAT